MHKFKGLIELQRHLLVAICICILIIVNAVYTSQTIDDYIVQRSYHNVDSMVIQMSKDIYTNFSNAQSQLQLITRLASRENFQNRQDLQNYLDELTPNDNLDSYSILLPDGTLLQKNDHIKINTPPQDYDMLLKKGTFISKILTGDDGRKYIAIGTNFAVNKSEYGIFYGLISVDRLRNFFDMRNTAENTHIILIDGSTGDILLDTIGDTNINIKDSHYASCPIIKGNSFEQMLTDMQNNNAGQSTYDCQNYNAYVYSSYQPVGIFNLSLQVTEPENSVLAAFNNVRTSIRIFALIQSLLCCVAIAYLIFVNLQRRHRYKTDMERNKFSYAMQSHLFGVSITQKHIKEVLSELKEFVHADLVHFAIMDGTDRKRFFCYPLKYHATLDAISKKVYNNISQLLDGHRSVYLNEERTAELLRTNQLAELSTLKVKNLFIVPERKSNGELVGFLSVVNLQKVDGYEEMLENIADNLQMAIQNVEAYSLLQKLGNSDELTGLMNRNAYEQALNRYEASPNLYCCIYADANGLHDLNNTYGHEAGDKMLITVATAMKIAFGGSDTYRIGGDEFIAFTADMTPEDVETAAAKMKADLGQHDYHVSMGWAFQNENQFLRYTISLAEKAMYRDKELYYKNIKQSGKVRSKNQQLENILLEKGDQDFFLRTIASNYLGVYIVNLATDDTRIIFRPSYYDNILKENGFLFRSSIRKYAENFVDPVSWLDFSICYDFATIEQRLKTNKVIDFVYTKIDGSQVMVRIYPAEDYSEKKKNTLWIFESISQ